MKNFYFLVVLTLLCTIASAQAPANYYSSADGLTGYTLKTQLKRIINSTNDGLSPEYTHNNQGDNLDALYATSDRDNYYENDNTILDIYSEDPNGADPYNYNYGSDECGNYDSESDCYNKEHIIPQSAVNDASPMVDDAHHVVPTDGRVNGFRSNLPFGVVDDSQLISQSGISNPTMNGSKAGGNLNSGYSAGYTGTVFEPIDEFKGDVARMYFYFVTRYEDQVDNWSAYPMFDGSNDKAIADPFLNILLTWHQNDPVSQKEIDRNNAIFNYQNNRNPFVDNPQYVTDIWVSEPDTEAPSNPTNLVASNPTNSTINLTWTASTDNVAVDAYDIYIDSVYAFSASTNSATATGLNSDTTYCFTVKAIDASNNESGFSNQACETTTDNGSGTNCALEDFENIPASSSSYTSRTWTGTNGQWNASEARTDQTIDGRAILIDFRNTTNGTLTSPIVPNGIGDLTITTQRNFTGTDGTLDVLVNGNLEGTIAYNDTVQTITIPSINVEGDVQVVIQDNDSGSARVALDNLSWTCYSALSVDDNTEEFSSVYPNPVRHKLNVKLKADISTRIEIYDIMGKRVLKTYISNSSSVDVRTLTSGIYLIKISQGNSSVTKRLIKR
ncbi:endonuclease [Winogradskyella sp. MIT101101]|uniref:endonuclease n=1 Tax=Winogradskyella sp. MIT101101 TaxID=3098297 RepID=UPI00399ADAA4